MSESNNSGGVVGATAPTDTDSKFWLASTTQVSAILSSGFVLYGIYARATGKPVFQLTPDELIVCASIICNAYIMLDRFNIAKPKKALRLRLKRK